MTSESNFGGLMRASLRGDAAAYRILLGGLSASLRAYFKRRLARIGRSASEAEDLTQETLMAIHSRRHTYHPSAPFLPWVHAIARYKLIDHLRRTRATSTDVPIEQAKDLVAESDYAAAESAQDIQRLMGKLPGKMRGAIESVKLEGLSVAEAAQRTGISESDVKISVHRGLKKLTEAVSPKRRTS